MSTAATIAYRTMEIGGVPVPGRYFDCTRLGIGATTLTTEACGRRWVAAPQGSPCTSCEIRRLHHGSGTRPAAHAVPADPRAVLIPSRRPGTCLRCGRSDLRLVQCQGICIACANRQYEWRKGRNSKGTKPATFMPLQSRVVGIRSADGEISYRELATRHDAEALGLVARRYLPDGATFTDEQPGLSAWNVGRGQFEYRDRATGRPLMVRRRDEGGLRYLPLPEDGELPPGWAIAVPRQQVSLLDVVMAALVLAVDAWGETPTTWTPTGYACAHCRRSPLEVRRAEGQAEFDVRCPACGEKHMHEHMHDAVAG